MSFSYFNSLDMIFFSSLNIFIKADLKSLSGLPQGQLLLTAFFFFFSVYGPYIPVSLHVL